MTVSEWHKIENDGDQWQPTYWLQMAHNDVYDLFNKAKRSMIRRITWLTVGDVCPSVNLIIMNALTYSVYSVYRVNRIVSKAVENNNWLYSQQDLARHMIQKDPTHRLSAEEYLIQERGKAFPEYFYTFLKLYLQRFASTPIMPADDRILRSVAPELLTFDASKYYLWHFTGSLTSVSALLDPILLVCDRIFRSLTSGFLVWSHITNFSTLQVPLTCPWMIVYSSQWPLNWLPLTLYHILS